jgi:hypothetical protein
MPATGGRSKPRPLTKNARNTDGETVPHCAKSQARMPSQTSTTAVALNIEDELGFDEEAMLG